MTQILNFIRVNQCDLRSIFERGLHPFDLPSVNIQKGGCYLQVTAAFFV